jgi:type IV secretory pathway VirB10-like protein
MAFDFSKLNFFNRLDARSRIFVIIGAVVGFIVLVYFGTRYFAGPEETTGPSRVAGAPQGLQSVPGGQLTPEYQRALMQANVQAAQQAQVTGGSAVPTMINFGGQTQPQASCVICSDQSANVKYNLDEWVRQGKISPDVANALQRLADKNVSVEEYADMLDRLVKEGKLTPEQARILLDQYKRQHANALLANSEKTMDDLIKNGQLPLDAANQLLAAQRNGMSTSDYAGALQDLVRQGKISPAVAQQLLAQYNQQRAQEIIMRSVASLQRMARNGEITADVERELIPLEMNAVPINTYQAKLDQFVSAGKLAPVSANKILAEFKQQKAEMGPSASVDKLLQSAEAAAYGEISDLIKTGQMPPEVGAQLVQLIQKNVSLEEYQAVIDQLVQQKRITPEIAKLKMADYRAVRGLRDLQQKLNTLQGNNASASEYADALRNGVQAGALTPDQAAQLMQEYQAAITRGIPTEVPTTGTTQEFNQLQQQLQGAAATTQPVAAPSEFETAQVESAAESAQDRQNRIEAIMASMSGQAQQLIAAWQAPTMTHKEGSKSDLTKTTTTTTTKSGGRDDNGAGGADQGNAGAPSLIKAGTILFAVLDTAVNSDYPTTPVMATIVDGKYKGAKLLGKLVTTKGVSGQMDRVSLNFNLMNVDAWPKSKTITAFAIDPDTARSVIASDVDYHYLKRFGAIMATSFVQGYANAITTSSSTSTTSIFGTSTTHPELSPGNKLAVGLGQIGQTLGAVTQNYVNIPPTVRVDSGVGLGILFMSDVT